MDNTQLRADLRTAARFLMDDGFSLDCEETIRIGMMLAELAGMLGACEISASGTPASE